MKALMIYDTVSETRMTEKVATAVAEAMREAGASVESHFIEDANKADLKNFDCLILGAPTMAWRPSKRMKEYLASLKGSDFSGKTAAAFDTQLQSGISGNATKHMEKDLKDLGFKIASPPLISYVESENKLYKLKEGELEKAKNWGRELAKTLSK